MVDSGNAKNCVLRYNSNGLELPDKLFSLWSHFKEVKFNFSIDAVGVRNEYIRYPTSWDTVVKNLDILDKTPDNITVNIACAIQALNVMHLPDLVEWKEHQNYKKINLPPYGAGLIGTHLVYLPSYLNVRVLPEHIKKSVTSRAKLFIAKHNYSREFISSPYGLKRYEGLLNYMNAVDWSHKLPMLKEYLEITDSTRGTNFKDVFPELRTIWN